MDQARIEQKISIYFFDFLKYNRYTNRIQQGEGSQPNNHFKPILGGGQGEKLKKITFKFQHFQARIENLYAYKKKHVYNSPIN